MLQPTEITNIVRNHVANETKVTEADIINAADSLQQLLGEPFTYGDFSSAVSSLSVDTNNQAIKSMAATLCNL